MLNKVAYITLILLAILYFKVNTQDPAAQQADDQAGFGVQNRISQEDQTIIENLDLVENLPLLQEEDFNLFENEDQLTSR